MPNNGFTTYNINISLWSNNAHWRIVKRFSEFFELYQNLLDDLKRYYPSGMQNLFPLAKMGTWVSGETDQVRNTRKTCLDAWLREICLHPIIMLNSVSRNYLYEFMDIPAHLNQRASSVSSPLLVPDSTVLTFTEGEGSKIALSTATPVSGAQLQKLNSNPF